MWLVRQQTRPRAWGYSSGDVDTEPQPQLSIAPTAWLGAGAGSGLSMVTAHMASTSPKLCYCRVAQEDWDKKKHQFITTALNGR